jgi:hypothetical protein
MASDVIVQSLKESAKEFILSCLDNPNKCGLTRSEKLWMEELSKIYLCAELHLKLPDHPTPEFQGQIKQMTEFGGDSALIARMIIYAANLAQEQDFFSNTASYMTTLEHHQEHWSQKHLEIQRLYTQKRPIEDFMHDYFDQPQSISEEELTYFLTLYFKHFYRLLYQFMLFYSQSHTPIYYGRANP